jgi:endonuclease/exonuclease/phosphatase family metal-dependent hydrolase
VLLRILVAGSVGRTELGAERQERVVDWQAVTSNLGCGGPHGPDRVMAAHRWAAEVRAAGWEIVFAQEIPGERWLDEWESHYEVFVGEGCQHRTRSALLVRHSIESRPLELPTQNYHGSYVAAATAMLPGIGEVALMSVHASPNIVGHSWYELWSRSGVPLPDPRPGDDLWDADLVLTSVQRVAGQYPVLAAGDWNEARAWDDTHPGASGREFFTRVDRARLVDCTWRAWAGQERATCRPSTGAELQVDHVFASRRVDYAIAEVAVIEDGALAGGSDHLPISFTLRF